MNIAGIDPGAKGAVCVLSGNTPALFDLDNLSIYELTKVLHKCNLDEIYIEDVHSLYGMSAKSNFQFGRNVGIVHAMAEIVLKGKKPRLVTPKVWQKHFGVTAKGKAIKTQVAKLAQELYPEVELHTPRGRLLDGRSDALMVASYGKEQEGQ